jgi:hypothetical protein
VQPILGENRWVGDHGFDLFFEPRLVSAAEDELGHKIRRPPRRFTQRHAEPEKIFGVHEFRLNEAGSKANNRRDGNLRATAA